MYKKMQIDYYNKKIAERIAEIQKACRIDDAKNPMMNANRR